MISGCALLKRQRARPCALLGSNERGHRSLLAVVRDDNLMMAAVHARMTMAINGILMAWWHGGCQCAEIVSQQKNLLRTR